MVCTRNTKTSIFTSTFSGPRHHCCHDSVAPVFLMGVRVPSRLHPGNNSRNGRIHSIRYKFMYEDGWSLPLLLLLLLLPLLAFEWRVRIWNDVFLCAVHSERLESVCFFSDRNRCESPRVLLYFKTFVIAFESWDLFSQRFLYRDKFAEYRESLTNITTIAVLNFIDLMYVVLIGF